MLRSQEDKKKLQQSSISIRSFEDDLNDYSSIRLTSLNKPSTSGVASTGASRHSPIKSPTSVISIQESDDSEIEEGEIVEREVTQCVDLIEESFSALKSSRKIIDLSPMKNALFFEDKRNDNSKIPFLSPPLYNSLGDANESQDVIIIDSTLNSTASPSPDDSVIFVSEEQKPLQKPNVLLSPAINELMKLSGVKLTPAESDKKKKLLSPGQVKRRERVAKWRKKKQIEYAQREVADVMAGNKTDYHRQPSTSTTYSAIFSAAAPSDVKKTKEKSSPTNGEKNKRIILIDGSNVAITHAKSKLGRDFDDKSPNAFSVEGLSIALKYFGNMAFQVKAVIPEYRLIRDKSSNPQLLHQLKSDGFLIPTPSKAYDDRILLESASRLNAAVVSNDYFRDFKSNSSFLDVLNNRQIRFNWVFDAFVLTEDSYGRNGPKLQDILYS